ncbi:hypothetical protein RRG08_033743 [Elysia crispata]|uniref:Uncharacterized protein n=1 Tax=Elysia crispata TaxID=231223 RepID=A0AAE1AA46_9GAST|nr:hypothetical protein RRG08_033743 [Elysia crispata]
MWEECPVSTSEPYTVTPQTTKSPWAGATTPRPAEISNLKPLVILFCSSFFWSEDRRWSLGLLNSFCP